MKVLVTGSTGLIGSALVPRLETQGHTVLRAVREAPGKPVPPGRVAWDPRSGRLDPSALEGLDAVVHLAGESISGRWTAAKKERIRRSRVEGTGLVARTLAGLRRPPATLVCASAVGYYGNRGDEVLRETSAPGTGFLADVCREWEAAAEPARAAGIRVVHTRFGVVLTRKGGALAQMLPPFRLGLGGPLGDGTSVMSWVGLEDAVGALCHVLETKALAGPVNATAPLAVSNAEFTRTLGRVLNRPTVFRVPAAAIRLLFGEMGEQLLLFSQRVDPEKLRDSGFKHRLPTLEDALRHELQAP